MSLNYLMCALSRETFRRRRPGRAQFSKGPRWNANAPTALDPAIVAANVGKVSGLNTRSRWSAARCGRRSGHAEFQPDQVEEGLSRWTLHPDEYHYNPAGTGMVVWSPRRWIPATSVAI